MRQPTSSAQRWEWWERAIEGDLQPIVMGDDPPCGFFKARKFRHAIYAKSDAPWLPARIYPLPAETDDAGELLEPERLVAELDGRTFNPWLNEKWLRWKPITEAEWKWLRALSPLTMKAIPKSDPPR